MRNVRTGELLVMVAVAFALAPACDSGGASPGDGAADWNGGGSGGGGAGADGGGSGGGGAGADGGEGGAGAGGSGSGGGGGETGGSVEILAKFGEVVVGGGTPMRALVRDGAGKVLGGRPLVWVSDSPAIATVDAATGIVTGVSEGEATISVSSDGAQASLEVRVEPAVAEADYIKMERFDCFLTRAGRVYCHDYFGQFIRPLDRENPSSAWHAVSPELRFKAFTHVRELVLALGLDGRIYQFGAYGFSGFDDAIRRPTPLSTDVRFKAIAAQDAYIAALSEDGSLYEVGARADGNFFTDEGAPIPVASSGDTKFESISVSRSHTFARSADGRIFNGRTGPGTWSCPRPPEYLGVPKSDDEHWCHEATELEFGLPFVSVVAGDYVSFGITADGTAYSWGSRIPGNGSDDPRGMLLHGRGESAAPSSTPLPLATDERFAAIAPRGAKIVALRADGVPFLWGWEVPEQGSYTTGRDSYVPTPVEDLHVTSVSPSSVILFEPGGSPISLLDGRVERGYFDQQPSFGGVESNLTLMRGSSHEIVVEPYAEALGMTGNGIAFPAAELSPVLTRIEGEETTSGSKLEDDGVTFELAPPTVAPGQAATVLAITATDTARVGQRKVYVGAEAIAVSVVPPLPPEGTPLNLRCDGPESVLYDGYWCLTNSGGATAPHKWKDLPLAGSTWQYENVCISYGGGGRGDARFKEPSGAVTQKAIRYGVLSRSNGEPEVTTSGHWLLYHEGIGDPQVEQLTFRPEIEAVGEAPKSGVVGEAWPFREGSCTF